MIYKCYQLFGDSLEPAATVILWMIECGHAACGEPLLAVREALARSNAFDAAFCFQCKPSKCAVAACPGVHTLATLALQRGYKQVQVPGDFGGLL